MPRKYKKRLDARKYKCYSEEHLKQALSDIEFKKMSLRKASEHYSISLGTLSHHMNKKHTGKTGHPFVFNNDEEATFVEHPQTVAKWGFPFDSFDLRLLAKNYLDSEGRKVTQFNNNFPSAEWANSFIKRQSGEITFRFCQNIKRSRSNIGSRIVKSYFDELKKSLTDESGDFIPLTHIYNKSFCKAEHIWTTWTEGGTKGTRYNKSKSGWFDACCFADWFESILIPGIDKCAWLLVS
ncbi:hypothetical protein LOTGIDRAFT_165552 [Lottia gigantea]|uniref:HTH psq-type domain-containing protein n=1 Tax=Lottia gigantea TaxID=225164 RepID=V3ZBN1_LOTGI|nr:hypothetical protein LOTGIDRAFT_165552 [Lottia gigantea]ESO88428.1 hypothetical protein LOTGIDRAFT_165552 [Lottia gigantea]